MRLPEYGMAGPEKTLFKEYLLLRDGLRYTNAFGKESSRAELCEELRSPDPLARSRAWDSLCGAWEGKGPALAPLLAKACLSKGFSGAGEAFGAASAPLLEAARSLRGPLLRALEVKAGRVGTGKFRYCDLQARLPFEEAMAMPLAEGLRLLGGVFGAAVEGGRGFVMEFFPGGRLFLEGDRPHCFQPEPGAQAVVYLPERFSGVYPADLPVIAHELGHALHCDAAARLAPGKAFNHFFSETLSQLFEELAWARICDGAGPASGRADLPLARLNQLAADFLLTPASLELEEAVTALAGAGGLTPESAEKAEKESFGKWFGLEPEGARFWMRSERFYDPEEPFHDFVRLAGRILALDLVSRAGGMTAARLDELAADTVSLDLPGWLSKRFGGREAAAGDWMGMLAPALEMIKKAST